MWRQPRDRGVDNHRGPQALGRCRRRTGCRRRGGVDRAPCPGARPRDRAAEVAHLDRQERRAGPGRPLDERVDGLGQVVEQQCRRCPGAGLGGSMWSRCSSAAGIVANVSISGPERAQRLEQLAPSASLADQIASTTTNGGRAAARGCRAAAVTAGAGRPRSSRPAPSATSRARRCSTSAARSDGKKGPRRRSRRPGRGELDRGHDAEAAAAAAQRPEQVRVRCRRRRARSRRRR